MFFSRVGHPWVAVWLIAAASAVVTGPKNDLSDKSLSRVRRQGVSTPQLWPGPVGSLNVPIPVNVAVFGGSSQPIDNCPRDEVTMEDGTCQQLLTQGNCKEGEYVLLNPENDKGYCAPRLCPPDRVFVFSTQLCHDPREQGLCPPGRELYETSYGTPVCSCPDGTFEGDDDLDDDVCEPILGQIANCPPGQVFWFRKLNEGPMCLPDPCNGLNLNRGPNDLPFLPSLINGQCFQMGSSEGVCPPNTWYGLELDSLKGVCATLEEFGYNVFNSSTLNNLISDLGSPISDNTDSPIPILSNSQQTSTTVQQGTGQIGASVFAGNTPASVNVQNSGFQPQVGSNQPSVNQQQIQTISHIQSQIGALQQQLKQLQQSLTQTVGANEQQTSSTTVRPQITTNSDNQVTNFISRERSSLPGRSVATSTNNNNKQIIRSPLVIKATLESQFSTMTSPRSNSQSVTFSSGQNQISTVQPSQRVFTPKGSKLRNHQSSPNVTPFRTFSDSSFIPSQPDNSHQSSFSNFNPSSVPIRGQSGFRQNVVQANTPNRGQDFTLSTQGAQTPSTVRNVPTRRQNANPNLQIQLEPLDFIHFQNQQNQQGHLQFNSIESIGSQNSFEQFDARFLQPQGRRFGGRGKRAARRPASRPRRRRSPLPHASPSNVFESRLLGCRGGAIRDINAKCRNIILPSRIPKRPVRAAPPIKPRQPCSGAFNIFRICVSSSASAQSSINAFALG